MHRRHSASLALLALTATAAGAATVTLGPVIRTVSVAADDAAMLATPRTATLEGVGGSATVTLAPGVTEIRSAEGTIAVLPDGPRRSKSPGATTALAGASADWNNLGGTAGRDGRTTATGPVVADASWAWDDFSLISWHPVTDGTRAFAVRQTGFPNAAGPGDRIVCLDITTGAELWATVVPYAGNSDEEWIAYVAGANDGMVYAARGGSGRTTPVYAFDAATGTLQWSSAVETVAGPYDGIVFAPDGDLIVGDFDSLTRIDATDGSVVWDVDRNCPVSGACGAAIGNGGVYIDVARPGGNAILKLDLATGAELYETDIIPGFTVQNSPFVAPDGTVYLSRTQNNAATDFLYAFEDTGSALTPKWNRSVRWTTSHIHGAADDNSIYAFLPTNEFVRLDAANGDVIANAGALGPIGVNLSPRTAVDATGTVYVSNGWASSPVTDGRLWAFDANLDTLYFTLELNRQNSGTPVVAADGTLLVADRQGIVGYRPSTGACPADVDGNGDVGLSDLVTLLAAWDESDSPADIDDNGIVDLQDLLTLLGNWGPCSG